MKKVILLSFLTLVFSSIIFSQVQLGKSSDTKETIIDVNFCDLFENPSNYNNKVVRVTEIYRFGFEWSDFYCPSCDGIAWMNFEKYDKRQTKKKHKKN